jgi:hypothetical protein
MISGTVYKELFRNDSEVLDPDDVQYALDAAEQKLCSLHPAPARWAPYIRLEM